MHKNLAKTVLQVEASVQLHIFPVIVGAPSKFIHNQTVNHLQAWFVVDGWLSFVAFFSTRLESNFRKYQIDLEPNFWSIRKMIFFSRPGPYNPPYNLFTHQRIIPESQIWTSASR